MSSKNIIKRPYASNNLSSVPNKINYQGVKKSDLSLEYKDRTDPKYIGPGTWNVIHTMAYDAKTTIKKNNFIEFMKEIISKKFPCPVCREHCVEYIRDHPLEEYLDVTTNETSTGLFLWTWKFHNAVNARLDKPIMDWNTAVNLYGNSESLICSAACASSAK